MLTDEQIDEIFLKWNSHCYGAPMEAHRRFAREILAAHNAGPQVGAGKSGDVLVTNVPERIYLNIGDIDGIDNEVNFHSLTEVTWCTDQIDDDDIEYVRATHPQPITDAARDANQRVRQLERALVYVGHALHKTPQYQLCEGVSLIDGDRVRVKINGIDVEACDRAEIEHLDRAKGE